jgi:hypothetical protein
MRATRVKLRVPARPVASATSSSTSEDTSTNAAELSGPRTVVIPLGHEALSTLYELERHRGALEILLLLERERYASKSRLRRQLRPRFYATEAVLRSLVVSRLVQCARQPAFPFAYAYALTSRGTALLNAPLRSWPGILSQ